MKHLKLFEMLYDGGWEEFEWGHKSIDLSRISNFNSSDVEKIENILEENKIRNHRFKGGEEEPYYQFYRRSKEGNRPVSTGIGAYPYNFLSINLESSIRRGFNQKVSKIWGIDIEMDDDYYYWVGIKYQEDRNGTYQEGRRSMLYKCDGIEGMIKLFKNKGVIK